MGMQKKRKIKILISIIVLLILGTVLYSGKFVRDCLTIGFFYAISLGIIDILYKIVIERNDDK